MIVLRGHPSVWTPGGARRAVAVGVFDGLHLGHRRVLEALLRRAEETGLEPCVVTFDPHPLAVIAPNEAPQLLTTVDQRIELLAGLGVELVAVVPFDDEVRHWSPAVFVADLLVGGVGAALVVVGEDFRFGRDRTGHVGLLREMGAALGFETEVVPLVGADSPVSSSRIRRLIATGDVAAAAEALGRHYELAGTVVGWGRRGREEGGPTAEVGVVPEVVVPGRGVYAVAVAVEPGEWMPAVADVGALPAHGDEAAVLALHLPDVDRDLSDLTLAVRFVARLRDERRLEDATGLSAGIRSDIETARVLLT